MSEKFGMMGLATVESQYLDGGAQMTCGEQTASEVDSEVHAIIERAYKKAIDLLTEYRDALDQISEYLYKKETITGKEFMDMFREITGIQADPEEETGDRKTDEDHKVAERLQKEMDSYEASKAKKDTDDSGSTGNGGSSESSESSGTSESSGSGTDDHGPEVSGNEDIFDE